MSFTGQCESIEVVQESDLSSQILDSNASAAFLLIDFCIMKADHRVLSIFGLLASVKGINFLFLILLACRLI